MERLPKRRLNTDLRMEVSLVLDAVRINFNDLKDLTVSLVSDKAGIRVGRCQFSVSADGYSLHVKSPADNQRYLGPHRLVLVCAIGDDRATYDRPVVDLVATTAEVDSDSTLAADIDSQGVHDVDIPLSVTELNSSLIVGLLEETEAARDAANAAADKALKVIEPLEGKELQEKLVSGENIKTINGQSLLGKGNIEIEGGEGSLTAEEVVSTEPTAAFPQLLYTEQELSEEQKEQARKNIGVESSVFEAKYGETTYDEIIAAKNAGKWVILIKDKLTYHLSYVSEPLVYFATINNNISYFAYCNKTTNGWVEGIKSLEQVQNKTTTINEASTDTQYPSAKAVYDALQNVGGGGTSTPSGDPMHYMYVAAGAEYNDTGADIEKQGVYGDTITHKAGYWYLNELGDITNDEMRAIYVKSNPMVRRLNLEDAFSCGTIRTNIAIWEANKSMSFGSIAHTSSELRGICLDAQIEVFAFIKGPIETNIHKNMVFSASSLNMAFRNASKLSKIIGCFNCSNPTDYKTFENATMLKEVRLIRLKNSFSFANSPLLSKNSVLFAIQKAEATSAITITLHADAYARLAEDADIVTALAEKEFVSLASA